MNMRTFMVVLGAAGVLALTSACEVKTETGDGGSGGGAGAGVGGSDVGGSGGTGGVGGAGGAGGGMAKCFTGKCGAYITDNPPEDFCDDNPSKDIYDKLANCTCDLDMNPATMSACNEACKDSACMQKDADAACAMCVQDTAAGCGKEFNDCANDL